MSQQLYQFVKTSERLPEKTAMYICHIKTVEDGLTFMPVSYCQFDAVKKQWQECEVIDWLEPIE